MKNSGSVGNHISCLTFKIILRHCEILLLLIMKWKNRRVPITLKSEKSEQSIKWIKFCLKPWLSREKTSMCFDVLPYHLTVISNRLTMALLLESLWINFALSLPDIDEEVQEKIAKVLKIEESSEMRDEENGRDESSSGISLLLLNELLILFPSFDHYLGVFR